MPCQSYEVPVLSLELGLKLLLCCAQPGIVTKQLNIPFNDPKTPIGITKHSSHETEVWALKLANFDSTCTSLHLYTGCLSAIEF